MPDLKSQATQQVKTFAAGSWLKKALATVLLVLVAGGAYLMHQPDVADDALAVAREINTETVSITTVAP